MFCCVFSGKCESVCGKLEKYVRFCSKTKTFIKDIMLFCNGENLDFFLEILQVVQLCICEYSAMLLQKLHK